MLEKFFGIILLCAGLAVMGFAFLLVYGVFSGVNTPPEVFKMETIGFTAAPQGNPATKISVDVDPEARKVINMALYYLFMFFVTSVGAKIAGLGVQLIKEIHLRQKTGAGQ